MEIIRKFEKEEARINGDPMSDMLKPRLLTKTEVLQAGIPAAAVYRYCNIAKKENHSTVRPTGEAASAAATK